MADAAPATFCSRDRARRFARSIDRLSQDRVLAWRGEEVGMAVLSGDPGAPLAALIQDLATSRDDVVDQRVRDRERPLLDVPFAVMAHGLWLRAGLAQRIDEGLAAGRLPVQAARATWLGLLAAAGRRIDAFCLAYDEKRPLGLARPTEIARILERVEAHACWAARGRPPDPGARAFDRPPPPLPTDAFGLEDLLLAAREAAADLPGPWRVRPGDGGEPLELALGEVRDAAPLPTPGAVSRAAMVLAFDHPVEVRCHGGLSGIDALTIRLTDTAGGSVALATEAATGGEARLSPEAEKAVRALLAAPRVPEGGVAPPQRLVALLGLVRALDAEILRVLLPALASSSVRRAAAGLPRETTRKAPLRPDVLGALGRDVPGLPVDRADAFAEAVAAGKCSRKALDPTGTALLLALFGRSWTAAGERMDRVLPLGSWTDAEAVETARDLLDVSAVRRALEAGGSPAAADLTRLERAAIAVLGRLGRL